jgi:hypothetical protein
VGVRRPLIGLGCAALIAATVLTQSRALDLRKRFNAEEDILYLPRPSALKAIALGHHELAADLVFMRAIIYFGAQLHGRRDYHWLDNYLNTIVALDPHWRTPYRWAGVATMYDGRTITNESVMESSHFLELGTRQFPDDWELPFMLGCNYLFELKTDDPAEKARWKRIGGEYVRHAALVGGGPSWLPLLAATIMRQEGEEEAAVRHLEEVYLSTQDPKTREQVGNRLLSLHAQIDLARAERERVEFERAWKSTVPYASPDFFAIVGERPKARLDLQALEVKPLADLPVEE